MARIRTLKPEIWMSPQVMNLGKDARLLFIGLITQADDEGRGTADARRVKAAIFGGDDDTSSNVRRMLDEIAAQGLITIYHDEKHGDLYALRSWRHHQKIDKPKPSGYPAPPNPLPVVDTSATRRRGSEGSEGSLGSEGSYGSDARRIDSKPSNDPDGSHLVTEALKAIYPPGTYRASNWILAQREVSKLLDGGEHPEDLLALARAFRAQQDAKGSTGTQFVLSPEKFFGPDGHWRGPFPIPALRAALPSASDRIGWRPDDETAAAGAG